MEQLNFETAMNRLEQVVRRLSDESLTLDESIELYAEGAELSAVCDKLLKDAKLKIDTLFPESEEGAEYDV